MSVNDSEWSFPVVLYSCCIFFCTFIHFEKPECVINREITGWKMAMQEKNGWGILFYPFPCQLILLVGLLTPVHCEKLKLN